VSKIDTSIAKFRLWWVPQVPMTAFERDVPSYAEAKRLEETLAAYDAFQFENGVKPDYCNTGGVLYNCPGLTDGWEEISDDEIEELGLEV
jgi:Superinfection exclusion gene product 17